MLAITPEEAERRSDGGTVPASDTDGHNYFAFDGSKLSRADGLDAAVAPVAEFIHDSFRALVTNPRFTCVAAKSAFNKNNYRFGVYDGELGTETITQALAADLERFVSEQDEALRERGFSTFVATFTGPPIASEGEWERLVWEQLQALHDLDAPYHAWDETVSADPDAADFAFSFAGRAFFVVGMHAASSRLTRRFAFPTLVFNAHFQFEELRVAGKYGRMQDTMRSRDTALQGDVNPNLANFGDASDARQYSGRRVEANWQCPFHAHLETMQKAQEAESAEAGE